MRGLIDSTSVGDPERFVALTELEGRLGRLSRQPTDEGTVDVLVRRGTGGRRELLQDVTLSVDEGVPGDAWGRKPDRKLDAQIAAMQADVATLIANGQPITLFGDSLFLDLDLSQANLPAGSRVQVGEAVLEVTPLPHNGCLKFKSRFGQDALRFVAMKPLRHRNLRGIYFRVIQGGPVRIDDPVHVLRRGVDGP